MPNNFVKSSLSPTAPPWEKRNPIQSPAKKYEDSMLLVSGVKNTITRDALWNLLDERISVVKRITLLQNERAIIFLQKPTGTYSNIISPLVVAIFTLRYFTLSNAR